MITVTVSGSPKSGKSYVASVIQRTLHELGAVVLVKDDLELALKEDLRGKRVLIVTKLKRRS